MARTWEALVFLIGRQKLSFNYLAPAASSIVKALHKGFNGTIDNEKVIMESLRVSFILTPKRCCILTLLAGN